MQVVRGPQQPADARQFAASIDEQGNVIFRQVGVQDVDWSARWGAKTYSTTQNTIAYGAQVFECHDLAEKFRVGDDVQVTALGFEGQVFEYGTLIARATDNGVATITVLVNETSLQTGIFQAFELQVVSRPKAWLEVDVSLTSVNPTTAGPWDFTVSAGKMFPIGGGVMLRPIDKSQVAAIGIIVAYSGTTLRVKKLATNATVSEAYAAWDVALIDKPAPALKAGEINGLRLTMNGDGSTATLSLGSMLDSTGAIDLVLEADLTKQTGGEFAQGANQPAWAMSANLTGTVAVSNGSPDLTGTGTAFTTELQVGTIITFDTGDTAVIATIADDDTATMEANSTFTTGSMTYRRGADATEQGGGIGDCAGLLIREDATGDIDWCLATPYPGGYDTPTGWTIYGLFATASFTLSTDIVLAVVHVGDTSDPDATPAVLTPAMMYRAVIAPTALGINATVVNANEDKATVTNHGRTTGEWVVLTGTTPAGLTTGTAAFVRAVPAIGALDTTATVTTDATANAAALTDGVTSQAAAACATKNAANQMYVQFDFSAVGAKCFTRGEIHGSNNAGYVAVINPGMSVTVRGKNGAITPFTADGTVLAVLTFTDTAAEATARTLAPGTIHGAEQFSTFTHFIYEFTNQGAANNMHIAEARIYTADPADTTDTLSFHATKQGALDNLERIDITATTAGWSMRWMDTSEEINEGFETLSPVAGVPSNTTIMFDFYPTELFSAGDQIVCHLTGRQFANTTPVVTTKMWQSMESSIGINGSLRFDDLILRADAAAAITAAGTWANQSTNPFTIALVIWKQ